MIATQRNKTIEDILKLAKQVATDFETPKNPDKYRFFMISEFGELLDIAMALKDEGHKIIMDIPNHDYEKIGNGIIDRDKNWWRYLGKNYIWIFDGCSMGNLQDWLREQGEYVCGGTEKGDELENDRQLGQKWFKSAGFYQPYSKNFTDIDELIKFVEEKKEKKWILKQNGDAPKSLNHKGKFDGSEDMLFHLKELKKGWNEQNYGKFDMDIMEVVEGMEVAASAFFNGHDYLRNKDGEVVGFLNFEEKKEIDGDMGETIGEMGTTFISVSEKTDLFKEILLKEEIINKFKELDFRGVVDVNCILTDKGIVALEPTMRFGIPATSYEFLEGMETPVGELIKIMAKGEDAPISLRGGIGMVLVVAAKPYPVEGNLEDGATSIGERLWILRNGSLVKDFSAEQKKHIHLQNFEKVVDPETKEICYKVATKNGYLLTITGRGESVKGVREDLIKYVKDNIYISGMKIRSDIGKRIESKI